MTYVMVTGPMGAGKSTFMRSLPYLPSVPFISKFRRITSIYAQKVMGLNLGMTL